jgi:hypothetical protein
VHRKRCLTITAFKHWWRAAWPSSPRQQLCKLVRLSPARDHSLEHVGEPETKGSTFQTCCCLKIDRFAEFSGEPKRSAPLLAAECREMLSRKAFSENEPLER